MSASERERQPELQTVRCSSTGRDHTIYPIGDWSVRTLWKWWSTASGCSPGLRLGLGMATTSHTTNVWFVPLYHQAVLQTGPQNPPLQAAVIPTHMWGRHPTTSPSQLRERDRAKRQTKCLHLAVSPSLTHKPVTNRNTPNGHAKTLSCGHAKITLVHLKLLNLSKFPL